MHDRVLIVYVHVNLDYAPLSYEQQQRQQQQQQQHQQQQQQQQQQDMSAQYAHNGCYPIFYGGLACVVLTLSFRVPKC